MTRRWIAVMSLASASLGMMGTTRLAHAGACVGTTCGCDDDCNAPFTCVDGVCCNFGPDSTLGTPCAGGAGGGPSNDGRGAGGSTAGLVAPSSGGNGGMPANTTPSPSASAGASDSNASSDADDDDGGCSLAAPDNRKPTRVAWGLLAGLLGSALFARRRGSSLR